jgi:hypothetical protein
MPITARLAQFRNGWDKDHSGMWARILFISGVLIDSDDPFTRAGRADIIVVCALGDITAPGPITLINDIAVFATVRA